VDWIKHNDTASLLGVDRDTLIQVLLDCCRDVITEAEQERVFLLEDHRLARLADDVTDKALQKVALSAMLLIAKSDGDVSEGEQTLLRFLMSRWGITLDDLTAA
jgi:tellurite resistance protein